MVYIIVDDTGRLVYQTAFSTQEIADELVNGFKDYSVVPLRFDSPLMNSREDLFYRKDIE